MCEVGSPDDPDRRKDLQENLTALETASDAAGRKLEILTITEASDADATSDRFCRSYINFYIANGGIVFPSYGTADDELAVETVQSAFPEHEIATVDINHIAAGGGGIHCITQQQPK